MVLDVSFLLLKKINKERERERTITNVHTIDNMGRNIKIQTSDNVTIGKLYKIDVDYIYND
jgi:hypothetical protein